MRSRNKATQGSPDMVRGPDRLVDRQERDALAYLVEENRILRAQLDGRRLRRA
jgi:hypothetical protein